MKASGVRDFKISGFQDFKISRFQNFRISRFQDPQVVSGFRISGSTGSWMFFQDSGFQDFQDPHLDRPSRLKIWLRILKPWNPAWATAKRSTKLELSSLGWPHGHHAIKQVIFYPPLPGRRVSAEQNHSIVCSEAMSERHADGAGWPLSAGE